MLGPKHAKKSHPDQNIMMLYAISNTMFDMHLLGFSEKHATDAHYVSGTFESLS